MSMTMIVGQVMEVLLRGALEMILPLMIGGNSSQTHRQ